MSEKVETSRRLYREEWEILEFLGGDGGGFLTRRIALHLHGNADLRRWSQLTRQTLLGMQRRGLVAPMDDDKPVVWCRTTAGTEALDSAEAEQEFANRLHVDFEREQNA